MHKANNRGCFHEEKRDKLLSDVVNRELDESVFNELESQGNEGLIVMMNGSVIEFDKDYELPCIGCSNLTVED